MEETPIYSLPFPTPDDFANGALDLQALAGAADTQISSVRSQYTAFTKRPTAIWQTSADQQYSANIPQLVNFQNLIYSNGATFVRTAFNKFVFPFSGLWMFGISVNVVASGTVNANTQRWLQMEADQPIGLDLFDYTPSYFGDSIFESSVAGGDFMACVGIFNYQAISGSAANNWVSTTINHNNTGSNLIIKQGATFFLHQLSNLDF